MAETTERLKAPFPWYGGKSRAAHLVWPRFGDTINYVEPFAGSLAVMLMRPHPPKNETVNDLDCYLANFWRALQADPAGVAENADWPVNEADLHARHQWLHKQEEFRERMHSERDFYDAKIAGTWVWGISAWIGDNWCRTSVQRGMPNPRAQGVNAGTFKSGLKDGTGLDRRRPQIPPGGIHKKPMTNKGGVGIHRKGLRGRGTSRQIPDISGDGGASGRGVHAKYCLDIYTYFRQLAERLRYTRVCCGQWNRILGPSPTIHIGMTAVFLDPPYGVTDRDAVYNNDSVDTAAAVREWCIEHGQEKKLRIAICGYDGEHNELEEMGWDKIGWSAGGGYANRNADNQNRHRERIWFSPHCLQPSPGLFDEG